MNVVPVRSDGFGGAPCPSSLASAATVEHRIGVEQYWDLFAVFAKFRDLEEGGASRPVWVSPHWLENLRYSIERKHGPCAADTSLPAA